MIFKFITFIPIKTVINLIGIALLGGIAFKVLKDYETQRNQGLHPTFNLRKLGIENTESWGEKEGKSIEG
jgi:AGCS family alanine or glycine:cation symporter